MDTTGRAVVRYLERPDRRRGPGRAVVRQLGRLLGPDDYRRYVLPLQRGRLIAGLTPGVPVIHFATGNPALLPLLAEAGGEVIGIDWRIDLDEAWQHVGHDKAVQGNLDPTVLLADHGRNSPPGRNSGTRASRPAAGHIFNLGHGVLPQTPVGKRDRAGRSGA